MVGVSTPTVRLNMVHLELLTGAYTGLPGYVTGINNLGQKDGQSSLPAFSNMSDVLRRQRLSADSPITALRFFNDDHGLISKAFALDSDDRIGDLLDHLLLLGVGENPFDHLDVGKWHLNAPFEVCCLGASIRFAHRLSNRCGGHAPSRHKHKVIVVHSQDLHSLLVVNLANGRVLFLNETGLATWVKLGTEFAVLGQNEVPGRTFATPAFSNGAMYLRTDESLYKFTD